MAVFKRWNGTSWEVIGPTISNSRINTVEELIAPEYDPNSPYSVEDFVVHSDNLYKCNTAIGSGGELWNSTHWTETKIGDEVSNLKSAIVNYSELYVDGETVISPKYLNKNSSGGKPTSNSNTRLISEPITMPPESTGTIAKSTGTSAAVCRFDETDTLMDIVYVGAAGTETFFEHCDHIRVTVQYTNNDPITPEDGLRIATLKFHYVNQLRIDMTAIKMATGAAADKVLKAKTVSSGTVTEWKFEDVQTVSIDDTLIQSGKAADAKATGDQIANLSKLYINGETIVSPYYLNKNSSGGKPTTPANNRLISEIVYMLPQSTGVIVKNTAETYVTVYRFDNTDTLLEVVYAGASGTETPFDHCDHIRVAAQYRNSDPITPSDGLTITTLKFRYNNPVDALYENESISMDAFLLKDKVPSQYLSKSAYPSTFDDDEYLEKKIAAVPLGKKFIFITDTHWESNEKNTVPLVDYVRRRLSVSKVVFGGDAIDRQPTGVLGKSMYANFMYDMKRAFGKDFIAAVGNHETNESGMKSSTYTDEERAEKLIPFSQMQPILNQDILKYIHTEYDDVSSSLSNYASGSNLLELAAYFKTIYYYDDAINKIRYIVLNTGNPGGLSSDNGGGLGVISDIFHTGYKDELRLQFDWFAASLLNTPNDYDVIVIGHQFTDQTAELNLSQYTSEIIGKLCSAAMMRASVTVTPRNVGDNWANLRTWYSNGDHTYNFSKAHMKSIIMMCGHEHFDGLKINGYNDNSEYVSAVYNGESLSQLTKGQIPLIVTTTDAYQRYTDAASGATQVPMELGTTTDHAFDVLTYTNDGIIIKRFGAGNDRTIYM